MKARGRSLHPAGIWQKTKKAAEKGQLSHCRLLERAAETGSRLLRADSGMEMFREGFG